VIDIGAGVSEIAPASIEAAISRFARLIWFFGCRGRCSTTETAMRVDRVACSTQVIEDAST